MACEGPDWWNRGVGFCPIGNKHVDEKRNYERSFDEYMHCVREWWENFSGHMVMRRGSKKMFSSHMVRRRGDKKFLLTTWRGEIQWLDVWLRGKRGDARLYLFCVFAVDIVGAFDYFSCFTDDAVAVGLDIGCDFCSVNVNVVVSWCRVISFCWLLVLQSFPYYMSVKTSLPSFLTMCSLLSA